MPELVSVDTVSPIPSSPVHGHKRPPGRRRNQDCRPREHLTADEVEQLIAGARRSGGRVAERDALLIMIAYRHGLRASELIALRWDSIDLKAGTLHVSGLKR